MGMTVVNAKIYVARAMGGSAHNDVLDMAGEAILRAYQDWQDAKFWRFLLKDASVGFSVTGVTLTNGATTINAPTSGVFDAINVGVTITVSGTATIAANSTVTTVNYNTDGTVASIVVSNPLGGTTDTNGTITLSGNIPIIANTRDYNAPTDFYAPYSALLTTINRTLIFRDHRYWDRTITNQATVGTPSEYTLYNKYSELTQNFGTSKLRFDRVPSASDTLQLRYYRKFNTTGTNIDIPDNLLYKFLDYASGLLVTRKQAQSDVGDYLKLVFEGFEKAQESDEEPTDDNDDDMRMKTQYEMGTTNKPLWTNGDFDPYRY